MLNKIPYAAHQPCDHTSANSPPAHRPGRIGHARGGLRLAEACVKTTQWGRPVPRRTAVLVMVTCCPTFYARHRTLVSYLSDLFLVGLLFIPPLILNHITPFERIVWRDDRSIMYPHLLSETVPTWALPMFAFVLPMIMITVWIGLKRFRNRRLLVAYVGLTLSLALAVLLTTMIKPLVGRPRPDFLARCDPDPLITTRIVCRGDKTLVNEGRRSFPSGHASSSFAGLMFAAFFLAGQMSLFDGEGRAYRLVVAVVPFVLAGFVGISRITDYRHHWQDVLAGAILGTVVAYLCYRMYFPAITSEAAGEPLSRRFSQLSDKEADKREEEEILAGPDAV